MTEEPEIAAAHTSAGAMRHWCCTVCSRRFSDAAGRNETTDLAIPPLTDESSVFLH
ncbi:MAG: hypothetical protein PUB98_08610 [Clostridiales bacterium]|nr:hypothetical protein [Clostridiales bacterium]